MEEIAAAGHIQRHQKGKLLSEEQLRAVLVAFGTAV